jgi:uncharacterized protein YbjT (DUF2867 family)
VTGPQILLTGATGYVGGRLLGALTGSGHSVRCLARRPAELASRLPPGCEAVPGDVLNAGTLPPAFVGVETAFYLVHSMGAGGDFETRDREAARNFGEAARRAEVRRIVYLGGLGDAGEDLSSHLRSRQEVGDVLRASGVAVIEFRASVVIGAGSLSFEMVRALVERLPIMVTPRWVRVEAQPIAIDDVLAYLLGALGADPTGNPIYEIGGADRSSYGGLMRVYARQRGLRRLLVPVPLLTPRLSSLWLALVTPLYARVGRKLISSIRNPTVVRDDRARRDFPTIRPVGLEKAVRRALASAEATSRRSSWFDALSSGAGPAGSRDEPARPGFVDERERHVRVPPPLAFAPIRRIGGRQGWYYGDFCWQLRGLLDLLVGGVGHRRGRRDAEEIRVGDAVDFWRVEAYEPPHRLRLRAEMRLPGRAWLEFEVAPQGTGSRIRQTATFEPRGLLGQIYWYGVYPLHGPVFRGMLRRIARHAEGGLPSPRPESGTAGKAA